MQVDCFVWQEHRFPGLHAFLNTQSAQKLPQLTFHGLSFSRQMHLPDVARLSYYQQEWSSQQRLYFCLCFHSCLSTSYPMWQVCDSPSSAKHDMQTVWLQHSAGHFIIFLTLLLQTHLPGSLPSKRFQSVQYILGDYRDNTVQQISRVHLFNWDGELLINGHEFQFSTGL